jgi:hypothetical protein
MTPRVRQFENQTLRKPQSFSYDHRYDIDGSDRPRRMNSQAWPVVFVQHSKNAKTASIFGLISHEVPAPNLARLLRPAVEIPSRFIRRCFLLTLIPSSRRIRATRFTLTSNPSRRISAVTRRYP